MLIEGQVIEKISPEIINFIEKVIKVADQFGMDRDETIESTAWIILEMMDMASYKEYQLKEAENSAEPKTRIESIQSMSVEELADKILKSELSTAIDFCQNFEKCDELMMDGECVPESECRKCLIQWLNSPEELPKKIPVEYFTERFNRVV